VREGVFVELVRGGADGFNEGAVNVEGDQRLGRLGVGPPIMINGIRCVEARRRRRWTMRVMIMRRRRRPRRRRGRGGGGGGGGGGEAEEVAVVLRRRDRGVVDVR
jgi:hypothetical protein